MESLLVHVYVSATYGSGAYGGGAYGQGSTLLGVLPNTGAGWVTLGSAVLLAMAAGWSVWLWQKRKARRQATNAE